MKRLLIIFLALAGIVLAASAQNPVRWRMIVKMTGENEGTVTLRALVDPGWHLYSTTLPDNGPRPTKFDFHLTGVTLDGKMTVSQLAVKQRDPLFDMELSWWESNVDFVQPFKIEDRDGAKISVTVNYMSCNGSNCLPPKSQTLTYTFK